MTKVLTMLDRFKEWARLVKEMTEKGKKGTLSVEEKKAYKEKIDVAFNEGMETEKEYYTKQAKFLLEKLDMIRQYPEIFYFSEEYLVQLENSPLETPEDVTAAMGLYHEAWLDSVCRMNEQMIQNFESLRSEKGKQPDDEDPLGKIIKAFRECQVKAFIAKAEFIEDRKKPPKTSDQVAAELAELGRRFDSIGENQERTVN